MPDPDPAHLATPRSALEVQSLFPMTFLSSDLHFQQTLAAFNQTRLSPRLPASGDSPFSPSALDREISARLDEARYLKEMLEDIQSLAIEAPRDADGFVEWFEGLKKTGPGQGDPLFPWISEKATHEELRWIIRQEVVGEAGFEDLVALTQLKMPTRAKLELARNYWDEMGRGNERGMHGPMLTALAREMDLTETEIAPIPESIALGNLMVALAWNREYAYHSIGALGVVELTAPCRARKIYEGLERVGVSPWGQRYHLLHSTVDVRHSVTWNQEVLRPLLEANPEFSTAIAEGALMRLRAGELCFHRYKEKLFTGGDRLAPQWVGTTYGAEPNRVSIH